MYDVTPTFCPYTDSEYGDAHRWCGAHCARYVEGDLFRGCADHVIALELLRIRAELAAIAEALAADRQAQ